ncbi:FAD-dependent oxidoreductase [Rhizobiaceae bacterium BDR2-2]|uniref:FAD-dependent oxidoreductase n=1 Tax=Ectorhizobium quercum TaxID=2965071 RepID=A0AAE3SVK5_9HYPH|nr:FAD-dependent oxidoreductase [Ectorhizobium quercum]MCX8996475.1 FAD-dependent oxidoreductase [Ectorhizobium quercum]
MSSRFKYIVIGRGMMGAAAARHLAMRSDGVALIGPGEPQDTANHTGVFASHYDEARITRTIDPDPNWALLANRSISRYAEIARESGIDFYRETGCLIVGAPTGYGAGYTDRVIEAGSKAGAALARLDADALAQEFPFFRFPDGFDGVHERAGAGYINPRRLVKAQAWLAARHGAAVIGETVASIQEEDGGVSVSTEEGGVYRADKVIVAAGGFTINRNLLPRPLALQIFARTVAFFELDEEEQVRFAKMPSLICKPEDHTKEFYFLPPVAYPDGKVYLKIGGDPDDYVLPSEPEIRAWFRSGGRASTRDHLEVSMRALVPGLKAEAPTMAACVTSFTPSGYPAIGFAPGSERLAVLAGGCGAAAKSSDEIGRLGAVLLLEDRIEDTAFGTDFAPQFL